MCKTTLNNNNNKNTGHEVSADLNCFACWTTDHYTTAPDTYKPQIQTGLQEP